MTNSEANEKPAEEEIPYPVLGEKYTPGQKYKIMEKYNLPVPCLLSEDELAHARKEKQFPTYGFDLDALAGNSPRETELAILVEQYKCMLQLIGEDVVFCFASADGNGEVGTEVLCSDTFGWACCDSEEIELSDAPMLLSLYKRAGYYAPVQWVQERRGGPEKVPFIPPIQYDIWHMVESKKSKARILAETSQPQDGEAEKVGELRRYRIVDEPNVWFPNGVLLRLKEFDTSTGDYTVTVDGGVNRYLDGNTLKRISSPITIQEADGNLKKALNETRQDADEAKASE